MINESTAPRRAVFGMNRGARTADIRDGTSQTIAIAEYLTGTPTDLRGWFWTSQAGSAFLFTQLSPNTSSPDLLVGPAQEWCDTNTNLPRQNLPCANGSYATNDFTAAARSHHAGLVHVLLCDGSVRGINDSIDLAIWRALGSIASREVISDF